MSKTSGKKQKAQRDDASTVIRVVLAPTLGWLRRLPEAGTTRDLADREESLMADRVRLERVIAENERALEMLRARAEKEASSLWTDEEIAAAKGVTS